MAKQWIKELIVNGRLGQKAFLYKVDDSLLRIAPRGKSYNFALSLLPQLSASPLKPATIFAWTATEVPVSSPEQCQEQLEFVHLLHETIKGAHPELRYLLSSRALRQGDGWLSIVDERAPLVYGRTPEPDDTIGFCQVRAGQVIPQSYDPMPSYRLITRLGIFSLPKPLHQKLLLRLDELN